MERNSPGDSVAVHSLAVFGCAQNTLKKQSQRFAQGCRETVNKERNTETLEERVCCIVTEKYTAINNDISHGTGHAVQNKTPCIAALTYAEC